MFLYFRQSRKNFQRWQRINTNISDEMILFSKQNSISLGISEGKFAEKRRVHQSKIVSNCWWHNSMPRNFNRGDEKTQSSEFFLVKKEVSHNHAESLRCKWNVGSTNCARKTQKIRSCCLSPVRRVRVLRGTVYIWTIVGWNFSFFENFAYFLAGY